MIAMCAKKIIFLGGFLLIVPSALAQTESQCLQSFNVDTKKNVSYIAVDPNAKYKVTINTASCVDAERFRERLYVSMDKGLYASEETLKNRLATAQKAVDKLKSDLDNLNDTAAVKAKILGTVTTVATVYAISTTAACASAVVDGLGIAACGPAARASVAAVAAWSAFGSHTGTIAALKSAAQTEIEKQQSALTTVSNELTAAQAKNMKENYSNLFVGICRAVQEQCL